MRELSTRRTTAHRRLDRACPIPTVVQDPESKLDHWLAPTTISRLQAMNEIEAAIADLERHRDALIEILFGTAVWRDLTRLDAALAALRFEAVPPNPEASASAGRAESSGL